MIPPDCKWTTARAKPPQKRGPRHVTPAMRAANAANGAKGAGKKSEAGRVASSLNSLQHGMACNKIIFLDDEDPAEFWADVDRRVKERGATSIEEKDLIVTAAYSRWVNRRVINATAAAINEERANIRDQFADGNVKQTRALIDRIATEPDVAVDELAKSTCGCEFLIGQFQLLDKTLEAYCSMEVSQRGFALRMGGHRPNELFTDKDVFDFNKAYFGGISGTAGFTAEEAGNALQFDRPAGMSYTELVRRLEPLVADIPSLEEGRRRMKAYFAREIARLTERKELVGYREERRLIAALNTAQAPVDRAAVTRARYLADSDRTLFATTRLLQALKKDRRDHGDLDPEPPIDEGVKAEAVADPAESGEPMADQRNDEVIQAPEGADSAVVEAPPHAETPAGIDAIRNEAVAPEVVGQVGDNEPVSPAPVVGPTAPAATELDPFEAIVEKYKKVFDELRQYDHLE